MELIQFTAFFPKKTHIDYFCIILALAPYMPIV